LVHRLWDGESLSIPIDGGVSIPKPGKTQDNVFISAVHDVEGDFLVDLSDIDKESGREEDIPFSVGRLINIADSDGYGEAISREVMLSDKGPVDGGDFCTAVDESRGVDDFKGVRGGY
jgi:hypothetical protein